MALTNLQAMNTGELLDRTFSLYRHHFLLFVGIAAVPQLFVLPLYLLLASAAQSGAGAAVMTAVSTVATAVLYLVVYGLSLAATVFAVSEVYLGRPVTIQQAYGKMKTRALRVIWIFLLIGLAAGPAFLLLIIPGVIVLARLSLAVPAALLENRGAVDSLNRSWGLAKGSVLRIAVVYTMAIVLNLIAAMILAAPLAAFTGLSELAAPSAVSTALLTQFVDAIAGALVAPLITIALCLIYYDQRVRQEAFDLQLMMAELDGAGEPQPPASFTAAV